MPRKQSIYLNIFLITVILLLTTVVYYKSVSFEFINWDDDRNVYENQDIRSLSSQNIQKMLRTPYLKMYQPLTTLSYAVEYKFMGANPHVFHMHNLILHLLNCLLVFILVFLLIKHSLLSALVAFLFALHPMHVESVAWITERKDVLYSFFYLLSLIMYIFYLRKNKSIVLLLLSLFFFMLSLLSKSAAITLPVILFLIDFKERRSLNFNTLPDKIPYILLSVTFGVISLLTQDVFNPASEITLQFHFYERFILGSYAFFFYLFKLIVPVSLSALHPFPVKTSAFLPITYFISFLGFILLSGFLGWILLKKKFNNEKTITIIFGFLFFYVTIGLIIFIPVGSALTAERYTYIPYIGLFISLAAILKPRMVNKHQSEIEHPKSNIRNFIIYPLLAFWLIFLSFTTYYRIDVWKNSMNFWDDIIKKYPANVPLAYNNRGVTKYLKKDYSGAILDFSKAIQQHPKLKEAYNYRALSRFFINDLTNSISDFDTTLMIDPKYADGYINRGRAKANFGNYTGAISDFTIAANINPNDYLPIFNRGILFTLQGRKNEAYSDFNSAIKINPIFSDAYYARGMVAKDLGNLLQACADFNKAAELGNQAAKNELLSLCR